ncbi:outer membrane protein assembly factor [Tamlana agarivorans]|uniref:Outer membrane protein assembly factor n=1 Tax=Pseudotamlana agarivorans TaxID=481183 RepID=A0ACC5U7B7_9FLAO|nr:BamA/TamA family outer membrane protein [Tamlana agarivorans]MBU2950223.1 outer membrane protein assembly factor [Tamlana agarivorans]
MNFDKIFIILFALTIGCSNILQAQNHDIDEHFDESSNTLTAVPLIVNNPTLKTGFGGMGMYFFKLNQNDTISPPSNVNVMGLYSTNDSHLITIISRLFWGEDRNRMNFATGISNVNNNFLYNIEGEDDVRLVFTEKRKFITLEYSRKLLGELYLGMLYLGTQTNYTFKNGTDEENEFARDFFDQNDITDNFVSSIGLNFSIDTRDYVYYPTKGLMFSIRPKFNTAWLGSDNNYTDTDFEGAYFTSIASNQVLGFAIGGGFATGDVPFDGYQNYGVRNNLRGYQAGKYKGKHMIAAQAEYRWRFYNRWGAVAFAGLGSIWGNDQEEEAFERGLLPAAGMGMRFMISREKRINLRLDYAIGVDGNQGLYFGVMEAF